MIKKDKQKIFEKYKEARLKPIKENDIEKVFKPCIEKEGKFWICKYKGTEFRNTKKKDLLRDLATVNGYKVT